MSNRNKIGSIVVIAAIILIAALAFLHKSNTSTTPSVHVAANLPLSGPLATYGTAVREGALMALDDLQKTSGPKIDFDWQDNASDPQTAVTILQKQLLSSPDIYVSGVKPQTMAIKDQIAAKGIPHFVWIFDAYINHDSKNNFRTWVNYKIEPPIYLDYAKKRSAQRVAIVYVQLPHTLEEFNSIVIPGLKQQGVGQLLVEPFDFGKKDFKDVAVKMQSFKPDLIILNGFQEDLIGLVRALRPLGLISDGNTIATYDMMDAAKILGPDELEGIRVVAPLFETRPDQPAVKQWRTAFMAKYGKDPLYTDAFAYDMVMIINDAAKRVKLPADSGQWQQALRATDIQGITGPLKFDNDGDLLTPLEIGVYRQGRLVPANQ